MVDTRAPSKEGGRTQFDIGAIFARFGARLHESAGLSAQQARVMGAIAKCRTAALGGHSYKCSDCDYQESSYNSCRDRHCPKCQGAAQYRWIEAQEKRLLNTRYFHVVFTLPAELRPLAREKPEFVYGLLMRSAAEALIAMGLDARRLGGLLGATIVLHTWSRTLAFHPHVHCIVTGGGISPADGRWLPARESHLFPVRALRKLFRGKFLAGLAKARRAGELELGQHGSSLVHTLFRVNWHTYIQAPFAGAEQVFRYLGAYTHRVGISNSRILDASDHGVTFATRGEHKVMLHPLEFIRRFLLHVLPRGFVKIRHYGLLASAAKTKHAQANDALGPVLGKCTEVKVEGGEQVEDYEDVSHLVVLESEPRVLICARLGYFICPECKAGLLRPLAGPDPPR